MPSRTAPRAPRRSSGCEDSRHPIGNSTSRSSRRGSKSWLAAEALQHRPDERLDCGLAGESATHQAAIHKHPAKSAVEARLGRSWIGPELVEMAVEGQPRHIVNRF